MEVSCTKWLKLFKLLGGRLYVVAKVSIGPFIHGVRGGPKAHPYIMFSSVHMHRSERNMSGNATCCHCQRDMFDRFLERPAEIQFCCKTGRNKTQATFFRSNPNPLWRFNSHIPQRILTHVSLTDVSCSDLGGETYYVAIKNPHSWRIARGKSRLMSILSISWNIWGTWRPFWNDLGESKTKDGITNFWNLLRKLIKMTTKKGQRVKES